MLFTMIIAHRWQMKEIAYFESFSIFQYILFFSWLPAWGIVLLRQGSRESDNSQKSFLFSAMVSGLLVVLVLFTTMILCRMFFLPWEFLSGSEVLNMVVTMICYFIIQALVYFFYLKNETKGQWYLTVLQGITWILLSFVCKSVHDYLLWTNISSGLTIVLVGTSVWHGKFTFNKGFWNEVAQYAVYLSFGAATLILASYYVQHHFGLGEKLNWYRYGTRELPVLPALIAGFGQSYLIGSNQEAGRVAASIRAGITFYLKVLILPLLILIYFAQPIFNIVYSSRFGPAAGLMSAYLLIYIPRMVPSSSLLQMFDERKTLLLIGIAEFVFIALSLLIFGDQGLWMIVLILISGTILERLLQVTVLKIRHQIRMGDYMPLKLFLYWSAALLFVYFLSRVLPWSNTFN